MRHTATATMQCSKCEQPIREAHLLVADNKYWHEDCLRCACCDVRLAELDKVCYMKARMPLCRRDYLRLYGKTGICVVCLKRILGFEFVMRIQENVYHLNCFCCQRCQLRFCIGDKFYLQNKTILCEQDYIDSKMLSIRPNLCQETSEVLAYKTAVPTMCHTSTAQTIPSYGIEFGNKLSKTQPTIKTLSRQNDMKSILQPRQRKKVASLKTHCGSHDQEVMKTRSVDNELKLNTSSDDHSSGYGSPSPSAVTPLERT
ncbi:LIM domain only protein 3 [Clonorchis sinensis]|uniref:LIM domain only protein 3 n=2 Tax=Clonorchis sinensis TaxID=79923 RepID=A0A3R7FKC4_CLOSI|nr:LIM domain only protein 3 [Clonorchis sinensis]